jgi:hypothetical protein
MSQHDPKGGLIGEDRIVQSGIRALEADNGIVGRIVAEEIARLGPGDVERRFDHKIPRNLAETLGCERRPRLVLAPTVRAKIGV